MPLEPGDKAPDFTLLVQNADPFSLSKSVKARKVLHLIDFYPKADTPGCTTQACELRDVASEVGGTVILGISPDLPPALVRFDEEHALGFALLSDPDHAVADAYGARGDESMYGKTHRGVIRSAFLVAEDGTLAAAWPKISPQQTPEKLRRALQVLAA